MDLGRRENMFDPESHQRQSRRQGAPVQLSQAPLRQNRCSWAAICRRPPPSFVRPGPIHGPEVGAISEPFAVATIRPLSTPPFAILAPARP